MKTNRRRPTLVIFTDGRRPNLAGLLASALANELQCSCVAATSKTRPGMLRTDPPFCVIFDYDSPKHSPTWDQRLADAIRIWGADVPPIIIAITRTTQPGDFPSHGLWGGVRRYSHNDYLNLVMFLRRVLDSQRSAAVALETAR
ncbi:MAG: hypothetical protein Q7T01_00445 [bacterium]|nr:hypothetical protein [bacterium]